MLRHLGRTSSPTRVESDDATAQDKDTELSFQDWPKVVGDKAELIAGNHRVEALNKYLQLIGSGDEERWWVCDIYDKGKQRVISLAKKLTLV